MKPQEFFELIDQYGISLSNLCILILVSEKQEIFGSKLPPLSACSAKVGSSSPLRLWTIIRKHV